ncbi:interferon-inducible GTPase 5-like [Trichomycterus rosablanca]|uniref:interferon-inducible GTPase 5-like n=1 Tax=Trichomycterus rosablanca TaxID=2290929 RepID=UPI002F360EED
MAHVQETSQDPDVTAVIEASGESTIENATKKAQDTIHDLLNVSLDVAVTGETGAGKSTFINAIRGLSDDDEGAAETGVTETTTEPTPYQHPTMPNVTFWDLPGIGSRTFQANRYLQQVNFNRYDFFIIISSVRFTENDVLLATEIRNQEKLFYFVRSKIDVDVAQEARRQGFNREATLAKIRNYCLAHLKDFKNPKVFLICCYDVSAFDFEELVDTLVSELPEHKRYALMKSVPVTSVAVLKRKVEMFDILAWAAAFCSGVVAVAPVPGLSSACDVGIVVAFVTSCYFSFGLDNKSIERLSERVNKPHLKSVIKSPLVLKLASSLLKEFDVLDYFQKSEPGLSTLSAAITSFEVIKKLLQHALKEFEDAALTVLREAGLE